MRVVKLLLIMVGAAATLHTLRPRPVARCSPGDCLTPVVAPESPLPPLPQLECDTVSPGRF